MFHLSLLKKFILVVSVIIISNIIYTTLTQLDANDTRDMFMALLIALIMQPWIVRQIDY